MGKEFHCHPDAKDPTQYSYLAALNGFKVIVPDAELFGERQSTFGYAKNFMSEINEDRPYAPNAEMQNNWRFLREKFGLVYSFGVTSRNSLTNQFRFFSLYLQT